MDENDAFQEQIACSGNTQANHTNAEKSAGKISTDRLCSLVKNNPVTNIGKGSLQIPFKATKKNHGVHNLCISVKK